jgi:hypothetical protein
MSKIPLGPHVSSISYLSSPLSLYLLSQRGTGQLRSPGLELVAAEEMARTVGVAAAALAAGAVEDDEEESRVVVANSGHYRGGGRRERPPQRERRRTVRMW